MTRRRASRKPSLQDDNDNQEAEKPPTSHSSSPPHTPQEQAKGKSTDVSIDKDTTQRQDKEEKRRLTEEEKKKNHINSEKKRRAGIRGGFDVLSEIIPGFEGMARSEGRVVAGAVEYGLELIRERDHLVAELESRGVQVDEGMKYERWDGVLTVGNVEYK